MSEATGIHLMNPYFMFNRLKYLFIIYSEAQINPHFSYERMLLLYNEK
jgi:hypothetical protein